MKHQYLLLLLLLICTSTALAQRRISRATDRDPYTPDLKPFYHGVASGDPTSTSVIIWTRVTPENGEPEIPGAYFVATDTAFADVVQTGTFTALIDRDYCVKIDVAGLAPGSTYYYYFRALGANSLIGRARTCPAGPVANLKFAVVSCANYEAGFFNAYGEIARRNDLDAVLHLGDYIYEYETGLYGNSPGGRTNEPPNEIVTLVDYRLRYSLYRLDPDLLRLHQQQTFINVWDDHESANNAWLDGAQNHQPASEGSWDVRKAISKQVYFEWMPIRDNPSERIYHKISYGELADVLMLDTRLDGRENLPAHFDSPDVPMRHIVSDSQYAWLIGQLKTSTARWKVIGNQVLFSDYNVGFIAGLAGMTSISALRLAEDQFMGHWEQYPTQRNGIIDSLRVLGIDNVVIVSGDSHSSWAFDVTKEPVDYPGGVPHLPGSNPYNATTGQGYTSATGAGSWAVEFATPSVSSPNYDENSGNVIAASVEHDMNQPVLLMLNRVYNPHLKYVDLDRHGYVLLDLRDSAAQADYYYVPSVQQPTDGEEFAKAMRTRDGENHLEAGTAAAAPKPVQQVPAPWWPPLWITTATKAPSAGVTVFSCFPNPTAGRVYLQIGVEKAMPLYVTVYDRTGRRVGEAVSTEVSEPGVYRLEADLGALPAGPYFIVLETHGRRVAAVPVVRM